MLSSFGNDFALKCLLFPMVEMERSHAEFQEPKMSWCEGDRVKKTSAKF